MSVFTYRINKLEIFFLSVFHKMDYKKHILLILFKKNSPRTTFFYYTSVIQYIIKCSIYKNMSKDSFFEIGGKWKYNAILI